MHNLQDLKFGIRQQNWQWQFTELLRITPSDERFGLTSQIRRAAVSIPSNITEGAGRNSNKDFCNFLGIANGSSYEIQTQLIISNKLSLLSNDLLNGLLKQIEELQKMNYAFQQMLSRPSQI